MKTILILMTAAASILLSGCAEYKSPELPERAIQHIESRMPINTQTPQDNDRL